MKPWNGICPVQLELELEEIACDWTIWRRLEAAKKFRRWARQLEVSAHIMRNREEAKKSRPLALPKLVRRKAALN